MNQQLISKSQFKICDHHSGVITRPLLCPLHIQALLEEVQKWKKQKSSGAEGSDAQEINMETFFLCHFGGACGQDEE